MIISKNQYYKLPKRLQKHFKKRGNIHPTVKPLKLMQYLVELTKMPNKDQIYLDPFMGSGTTAIAVEKKDRNFIGFEQNQEYVDICYGRLGRINKEYYEKLPEDKRPSQQQLF